MWLHQNTHVLHICMNSMRTLTTHLWTVHVNNVKGTDTVGCGKASNTDPTGTGACKSIKYGFHNRLAIGGNLKVHYTGVYYTGYDNM